MTRASVCPAQFPRRSTAGAGRWTVPTSNLLLYSCYDAEERYMVSIFSTFFLYTSLSLTVSDCSRSRAESVCFITLTFRSSLFPRWLLSELRPLDAKPLYLPSSLPSFFSLNLMPFYSSYVLLLASVCVAGLLTFPTVSVLYLNGCHLVAYR